MPLVVALPIFGNSSCSTRPCRALHVDLKPEIEISSDALREATSMPKSANARRLFRLPRSLAPGIPAQPGHLAVGIGVERDLESLDSRTKVLERLCKHF